MSSLPRIALYIPTPAAGGAEKVFLNLARGFAQVGHPVDLLLARHGRLPAELPVGVRIHSFGKNHVSQTLWGLVRYLRDHRPDVLFSALFTPNVLAVLAKRLARVSTQVVITEHTLFSQAAQQPRSAKARLLVALARLAYPYADDIVAVSEAAAADLATSLGLLHEHIRVIYNPIVTPALLAASHQPAPAFFSQQGRSDPIVVAAGRLARGKDFVTLIEAFSRLRAHRPARLVLLGEGTERAALEAQVARRGLWPDVHMPGYVRNPYRYFRAASVLVLSSRWEGFGNVLVEAMACGTPVVSTNCPGGPAEILQGGRLGPLVPVGDAGALAAAIERVLESPPPEEKLKRRARAFRPAQTVEAYRSVIAKRAS